MRGPN